MILLYAMLYQNKPFHHICHVSIVGILDNYQNCNLPLKEQYCHDQQGMELEC